jgi:hypothetical protein
MNMRNHRVLLFGGGACSVLLIIALVFLLREKMSYQKQRTILDRSYRRLAELNARKPFPSLENVTQAKKNLERLEYHLEELSALLARDPFPQEADDATGFSARAQNVIERFRKQAAETGVLLPESLEAGFSEYASGGAVPEPEEVPRLSRQLFSVEKVATVLLHCGVDSIDSLTRDMFEQEADALPKTSGRRRSRRGEPASTQQNIRLVASAVHPEGLYALEQVGVTFTATEKAVWKALDLLAASPHFMVVTDFSHTTRTRILSYDPNAVERSDAEKQEAKQFLSAGILSGRNALSRPERIMAGNERIRVSLNIEVYNFDPDLVGGTR